jgi:hypothetical protein
VTVLPAAVPFLPASHPFWLMHYFQVQCRHDAAWYHKGYENYLKAAAFREATRDHC